MSAEAILLLQIVLLIFAGRLLGEIMQRLGQPSVMGQLLGGVLLGPSVLGALWPSLEHLLFPASGEQRSSSARPRPRLSPRSRHRCC